MISLFSQILAISNSWERAEIIIFQAKMAKDVLVPAPLLSGCSVFSWFYTIANSIYFSFGLLMGENPMFEDVTIGSGELINCKLFYGNAKDKKALRKLVYMLIFYNGNW